MPAAHPVIKYWRRLIGLYRIQTDDMDLLRAQFDAFVRQVPLLYAVLGINALAVSASFSGDARPLWTRLYPVAMVAIAAIRGVWWWRRRYFSFSDNHIRQNIINTSVLAMAIAASFVWWGLSLYVLGDGDTRGHLTFFLALTLIACVFCLMPVRPAAYGVATIGLVPFIGFFMWADGGRMQVEALVMVLVGFGTLTLLTRYNDSFAALIRSRRDLNLRQIETQKLSDDNRRIALTDALSGLPNRRALLARLDNVLARQPLVPNTLGIAFIDLDGFKDVNDAHGHQMGDAVIHRVSRMLEAIVPNSAMLARTGGDEFAILFEGASAIATLEYLANQVLLHLALPICIDDRVFHIGASIGAAIDEDGVTNPHELLRRADTAMYRVKENGKSALEIYNASFDARRVLRQTIESDIRLGLERNEFEVYYQPVIDARTNTTVSVEALIRWPRRPAGSLAPDDFIEIAEISGLIQPIGLFVLRRACTDLRSFENLKLAVNISPAQFRHPDFEAQLKQVLRETRFPPGRLQLEITEGYLIDHPERAAHAIDAFKQMGVSVALDDFGTGYTSIAYLQAYGFDVVKLDKSLAAGLGLDTKASLLIAGMVSIANALRMRVIAEGVESKEQATLLRMAGCHELQGYLFGRPQSLAGLIARQRLGSSN